MEMVYYRKTAIQNARNYIYKKGESEAIVNRNFERALEEGNLSSFPNVEYFREKKEIEVKMLNETLKNTDNDDDRKVL